MDSSEKWDFYDSSPLLEEQPSSPSTMKSSQWTPKKKYVILIFVFSCVMTVFLLQNSYSSNHDFTCDCQNSGATKSEEPKKVQKQQSKVIQSKSNLNCYQKPFENLGLKPATINDTNQYAYVWYATQNNYLCSALVALKHLQSFRNDSDFKVDYVLIFSKEDFNAFDDNGQKLLEEWKNVGQ